MIDLFNFEGRKIIRISGALLSNSWFIFFLKKKEKVQSQLKKVIQLGNDSFLHKIILALQIFSERQF